MNAKKKNGTVILIGGIAIAVVIAVAAIILFLMLNSGKSGYQRQISIAEQCLASEDYDGAISAYYSAIELDRENETAYLALARVYELQGDVENQQSILSIGYTRTNSATIKNQLDLLQNAVAVLGTGKDSAGIEVLTLNEGLLLQFADCTYADYGERYKNADGSKRGETVARAGGDLTWQDADGYQKVTYDDVGVSFYYNSANSTISGESQPGEIHLDGLSMLFSGLQDQITYAELGALPVENLMITTVAQVGSVVSFEINGCQVMLSCDENGTVTTSTAWNCIVPLAQVQQDDEDEAANGSTHTLKGYVRSATTGDGIDEVTMTLYQNGQKVMELTSDSDGSYQFDTLPAGNYTVELSADGYITESVEVYISKWLDDVLEDMSLSPELGVGQIRIVLTWDATPRDLDSYLFFDSDYIFFGNKVETDSNGNKIAELDLDDVDGYGPETTTIYNTSGEFQFTVKDFHATGMMGSSGAVVKIYVGDDAPIVVEVDPGVENVWDVCSIKDGVVEVHNEPGD